MDLKRQIEKFENTEGFIKNNNIHFIDIDENNIVTLQANITQDSLNPYNNVHGGVIFGLGDTAMGIVAAINGKPAVTISSNISYLKPAKGKYLKAMAEMIKDGNNVCFLRCNIYNDKEILVATMEGNFFYINN